MVEDFVTPKYKLKKDGTSKYAKIDRGKAHGASTQHKELQATERSWELEVVLPREKHTNWLSASKKP